MLAQELCLIYNQLACIFEQGTFMPHISYRKQLNYRTKAKYFSLTKLGVTDTGLIPGFSSLLVETLNRGTVSV